MKYSTSSPLISVKLSVRNGVMEEGYADQWSIIPHTINACLMMPTVASPITSRRVLNFPGYTQNAISFRVIPAQNQYKELDHNHLFLSFDLLLLPLLMFLTMMLHSWPSSSVPTFLPAASAPTYVP